MKAITISAFMILLLFHLQNKAIAQTVINDQNKTAMKTKEQSAIEQLLFSYRDALNASDVSKVLPLYTKDGVFMPSNAPTSVGQEQVKGASEFVFKNIRINIEFFIDEIVVTGDCAFCQNYFQRNCIDSCQRTDSV